MRLSLGMLLRLLGLPAKADPGGSQLDNDRNSLIARLRGVVGHRNVLSDANTTLPYRTGYRIGAGDVLAVAKPGSLVELWRTAELCAACDVIMIVQAANTGLTGGSTPYGSYDRPVVVISTLRIDAVIPILGGTQSICLAGSTLTLLEERLRTSGRVPHSVIGSSCIGASVIGGICNNSGGALVGRGPAFTRFALFARVNAQGRLELVNNLGLAIGDDPFSILSALDRGEVADAKIENPQQEACLSDYETHVRNISAVSPARYNADSRCHFEAAGSAGKVIIFAVRVDSYPAAKSTATFLLTTDNAQDLADFRHHVLGSFRTLPVTAEYLHREAARTAATHGNDICVAIRHLGAARVPLLFAVKRHIDRILRRFGLFGRSPADHILQAIGSVAPHPLPRSIRKLADQCEHMLLVTVADEGIREARSYIGVHQDSSLSAHQCSSVEADALQRLRFATAGAMVRYCDVEAAAGPLVAIDCALPRNARDWQISLPSGLAGQVLISAAYGHFLCHVFHLDFVLKPGCDPVQFENTLVQKLHSMGVECPAEHNFGHHYQAPENVVDFYRSLDPTNSLNPGIGKTSK